MSHRICLTSDPMRSGWPTDKSALWVHHKSDSPAVERRVLADDFVANPRKYYDGCDVVVLLNLVSRIIRPGSRMKYGQFLTDPWTGPQRLSVDTHAFIGEPWRMWFHFGAVEAPFGEPHEKFHTSYRVETDWRFYLDGKLEEQTCNMTRLKRFGAGVLVWRDGYRVEQHEVEVLPMSASTHDAYQQEKEAAFADERTPNAIIKRLATFAQRACPERTLPDVFASPRHKLIVTDLGVDRWLTSQARMMVDLTNNIAEAFHG